MDLPTRIRTITRAFVRRVRGHQDLCDLRAGGVQLGRNVFVGRETMFDPSFLFMISVGDDTTIAARVHILAHDACVKAHLGYSIVAPVEIGSRVYIGAGATILPGVTIGDDAVIGAGSIVRRDIPAGAVAVGTPARVVGTTQDLIARHRALMRDHPVFPDRGWTHQAGLSDHNKRVMQEQLRHGHGYVR